MSVTSAVNAVITCPIRLANQMIVVRTVSIAIMHFTASKPNKKHSKCNNNSKRRQIQKHIERHKLLLNTVTTRAITTCSISRCFALRNCRLIISWAGAMRSVGLNWFHTASCFYDLPNHETDNRTQCNKKYHIHNNRHINYKPHFFKLIRPFFPASGASTC